MYFWKRFEALELGSRIKVHMHWFWVSCIFHRFSQTIPPRKPKFSLTQHSGKLQSPFLNPQPHCQTKKKSSIPLIYHFQWALIKIRSFMREWDLVYLWPKANYYFNPGLGLRQVSYPTWTNFNGMGFLLPDQVWVLNYNLVLGLFIFLKKLVQSQEVSIGLKIIVVPYNHSGSSEVMCIIYMIY